MLDLFAHLFVPTTISSYFLFALFLGIEASALLVPFRLLLLSRHQEGFFPMRLIRAAGKNWLHLLCVAVIVIAGGFVMAVASLMGNFGVIGMASMSAEAFVMILGCSIAMLGMYKFRDNDERRDQIIASVSSAAERRYAPTGVSTSAGTRAVDRYVN